MVTGRVVGTILLVTRRGMREREREARLRFVFSPALCPDGRKIEKGESESRKLASLRFAI